MNGVPLMTQHYHPAQKWLHWSMACMIAVVYVTMEFITLYSKGTTGRTVMLTTHYLLGLVIVLLALIRLWLWLQRKTIEATSQKQWQQRIASMVFILLYGLMIIVPLIGWVDVGLWDVTVSLFGWQLPQIVQPDKILAEQVSQVHILLANTGYGVIALHVCAAIYHHRILKDDTLLRMLPRKGKAA